jgi:hypothetical protein
MNLSNVEAFNSVVSKLFRHLAETFPHQDSIDASTIGLEKKSGYQVDPTSSFGELAEIPASADEVFFVSCVTWLEAEGYIRVGEKKGFGFKKVVLTAKGLKLIRAEPDSLNTNTY